MPRILPEFQLQIPEDEKYEGTEVDANVLDALPAEMRVLWASTYFMSLWAISTKLDIQRPDGSVQPYHLKIFRTKNSQIQAKGEYESTRTIYSLLPGSVPCPIWIGPLASKPGRHFYLAEYKEMDERLPTPAALATLIAKLHKSSSSPAGNFGFNYNTSDLLFDNGWCKTWEEFFTRRFHETIKLEQGRQGHSDELQGLANEMCTKVIPRLLRPMESNGRRLTPALLHGELWEGNIGVDQMTGKPILYDCSAIFGHNEYDLAMWRAERSKLTADYTDAYHKLIPKSDPIEDYEDRNALYALLRVDLEMSCKWPSNRLWRRVAIDEMKRLVDKYPDGFLNLKEGSRSRRQNQRQQQQEDESSLMTRRPEETEVVGELGERLGNIGLW